MPQWLSVNRDSTSWSAKVLFFQKKIYLLPHEEIKTRLSDPTGQQHFFFFTTSLLDTVCRIFLVEVAMFKISHIKVERLRAKLN